MESTSSSNENNAVNNDDYSQCIMASIILSLSVISFISLFIKILHSGLNKRSWLNIFKDSAGAMLQSTIQITLTSIQMSILIINRTDKEWSLIVYNLYLNFVKWDIYITISFLILMTANFLQKLVNFTYHRPIRHIFLIIGRSVVLGVGIYIVANIDRSNEEDSSKSMNGTLSNSEQTQRCVLFVSLCLTVVVLNFLICYRCFSLDLTVLYEMNHNKKIIPNMRMSVTGLCIQNITTVILCYGLCVLQYHDLKLLKHYNKLGFFWIYSLKSVFLPFLWICFPVLIPYLGIGNCGQSNPEERTYLTAVFKSPSNYLTYSKCSATSLISSSSNIYEEIDPIEEARSLNNGGYVDMTKGTTNSIRICNACPYEDHHYVNIPLERSSLSSQTKLYKSFPMKSSSMSRLDRHIRQPLLSRSRSFSSLITSDGNIIHAEPNYNLRPSPCSCTKAALDQGYLLPTTVYEHIGDNQHQQHNGGDELSNDLREQINTDVEVIPVKMQK